MDRYGVEGVQLISAQPVGLQVNRWYRQDRENKRHQGRKDQREKKNKKNKNELILEDQVTLMLKHQPNEKFMLCAPKKDINTHTITNSREGPKKRIDIKV